MKSIEEERWAVMKSIKEESWMVIKSTKEESWLVMKSIGEEDSSGLWVAMKLSENHVFLFAMKKASGNHQKHTNKGKKHDSQIASLPPISHPSPPWSTSLPPNFPPQSTSLPPSFPPQSTSLPSSFPPQLISLPPTFPPQSTSLSPTFFTIPPSEPIQNYSMPSHGTHTSLSYNSMPSPSCHISQHGSSSSLLLSSIAAASPASSPPSISKSNIGDSSTPTSSSISTTAPASSRAQNVGGTLQYDIYHRLILTPDEDGASTSQCSGVIEPMRRQIDELKQRCETFDANLAKIQKLMKMHIPVSKEKEETESEEE
ncbi:hypothetical protein HAX54_051209 [Datura stramonium]|uniref:Uncharacterized protein n=1 Tax=Datura stramonium TaxID=4076 RepID=A0ABS8SYB1_DATST|nr:hypothetical protein [Datura stramonium]